MDWKKDEKEAPPLATLDPAQWAGTPSEVRNQLAIYISTALVFGGFTVVMPFLPLYVRQLGVVDVAQIALWSGILISVTPMLAAALGPLWGKLGDRYGLKLMAQRVTISMVITWGLFGFASNVYHLLTLRILLGLFGGFNAVALALLTQGCTRDKVNTAIGRLQMVQITSTALGPVVGGFLAHHIGIRLTCLVTAGLCLISLILIIVLYQERSEEDVRPESGRGTERKGTDMYSLRTLWRWPNFATVAGLLMAIQFLDRSMGPIIPLYVSLLGTPDERVAKTAGLIISAGALAAALSSLIAGDRLNKMSPKRLLISTLFCGGLVCVPLAFVQTAPQLLVLRALLGLLVGGAITITYAIGAQGIPARARGASFGLFSSAGLLGGSLGPIVAGLLTRYSLRTVFLVNAGLYGLIIPLALYGIRRPKETIDPSTTAPSDRTSDGQ